MTAQTVFSILVLLYTVTNMASLGLELNLRETMKSLRSARLVVLTLLWGWVVGPAFAVLLTKVLPLAEPHAMGLLVFSLAPVAPMVSLLARRARSDMDFTAAVVPLAMVATVALLPAMAPWLMQGLTLNVWSLAKPLLLMVLLPLVVCAAVKVYASPVADKLFPVGQTARWDLHPADPRLRRGVPLPGHRPHGGQLCHRRRGPLPPRDSRSCRTGSDSV